MSRTRTRAYFRLIAMALTMVAVLGSATAQSTGYRVEHLASDWPGADHQAPSLLNPWRGMA